MLRAGARFAALLLLMGGAAPSLLDEAIEAHGHQDTAGAYAKYERVVAGFEQLAVSTQASGDGARAGPWALACHNMALIAHGEGDRDRALELVGRAVALDPSVANFHNSRGALLRAAGFSAAGPAARAALEASAAEAYRTAVALAPGLVASYAELGHALHYGVADALADPGGADFDAHRAALTEAAQRYHDALDASASAVAAAAAAASAADASGAGAPASGPQAPLSRSGEVQLRNDLAIALQKAGRPEEAAAVLRVAALLDPGHLQTAGNLVVALKQAGDLSGAEAAGRAAVALAPGSAQVRYNHGLTYQALGRHKDAAAEWAAAVAADPGLFPALASLGHHAGHSGDLAAARAWYGRALAALEARGPGDETAAREAGSLRLQVATACVPQIYDSPAHIAAVRAEFSRNLRSLLGLPAMVGLEGPDGDAPQQPLCGRSDLYIPEPLTSVGSGALGYYLIYTGHNDVDVRRLLASAYWCASPALRFKAPFLERGGGVGHGTQTNISVLRVGFLSGFFYHHSVGLLTRGVICGLASRSNRFHVTLLFASPPDTV